MVKIFVFLRNKRNSDARFARILIFSLRSKSKVTITALYLPLSTRPTLLALYLPLVNAQSALQPAALTPLRAPVLLPAPQPFICRYQLVLPALYLPLTTKLRFVQKFGQKVI